MKKLLSLAGLSLALWGGGAQAVLVTVPGTSDPWLAGMPNGSTASSGDVAPAQSPVLVSGLNLSLGGYLTFTGASGGVMNFGGCPPTCDPIDGGSSTHTHFAGAENGISNVTAPTNALLGVFLDNTQPDSSSAPAALDFSTSGLGLNFLTLSPLLKQVFFIGDGRTSTNVVQQFNIPAGATRLFLGTMDGFGWFNNSGTISINVTQVVPQQPPGVPEPATWSLLGLGLAGLAWRRKAAA